jgi:hypothetical protein
VPLAQPTSVIADPARTRGLRRARKLAACPPVEPTLLPPAPSAGELLALLTRVRSVRVSQGELAPARLHDVRAFKTAWAELAYLRRLAAGGRHGGTVVTSMRQLVAGLAALHPAWKVTGEDGWEDRDRHHQAVRRRLRDLQAMGLLRWRVGVDEHGEERRTELELHPAPQLTDIERAAAAARLGRWEARYGPELDTGSATGIIAVKRAARPLSASERQRRGCQQARARRQARGRSEQSQSNSAPPCGAQATPENNNLSASENDPVARNACQRTGVTRASAPVARNLPPALDHAGKTAGNEENRSGGPALDFDGLLERVAARQAARAPVLAIIAAQAQQRAFELAGWGLERSWPASRLREAWVVARYGQSAAAQSGAGGAGPLYGDDYARLRRAVARYERNRSARPDGFPASGLGGLLQIGALASETAGPRTVRYAIGALDQLSRRMRAHASAESVQRISAAQRRACGRRIEPPASRLAFRLPGPRWPSWLTVDEHGLPVFSDGLAVINPQLAPPAESDAYRTVIRDAYLIAGCRLPLMLDGRTTMRLRDTAAIPPADRRGRELDRDLTELAHRTGQPQATWAHVRPELRAGILAELRATDARQARAETQAFREHIAQTITTPGRNAPQ